MKNHLALFFLIFSYVLNNNCYSQERDILNKNITLKFAEQPTALAVLKFLKDDGINISYPGDDKTLEVLVEIPLNKSIILKDLLDLISRETPFGYQTTNGYIILKKKALNEAYQFSGKILDATNNEPLIGATVAIRSRGALTDPNGAFDLTIKPGTHQLVVRYVGFETYESNVNIYDNQYKTILLKPSNLYLDEVQITSKAEIFGDLQTGRAVETVDSKTVEALNVNNPMDALHGRINGVWTTKMSGAPGDHQKIRIRGISSLFGSVDPLYVVDNVPVPKVNLFSLGVADLNAYDIENIHVLKDASSTALYGYQGGSGVILIETKKGGENQVNFMVKQGTQWTPRRYDLSNSYDFLQTYKLSDVYFRTTYFSGIPATDINPGVVPQYPEFRPSMANTDWQDVLFRMGEVQEYQLSFSGALKNWNYYLSGNLFEHEGVVKNTSYDKTSVALNVGRVFNDRGHVNLAFKSSEQGNLNNLDNFMENRVIFKGLNVEPSYRSTPDSILTNRDRLLMESHRSRPDLTRNIRGIKDVTWLTENDLRQQDVQSRSASISARYNPFKNLFISYNSAISTKDFHYVTTLRDENTGIDSRFSLTPDLHLSSREKVIVLNQQAELSYHQKLNRHNLTLTAGYRNYRDNIHWKLDSILGVDNNSNEDNIYMRGSMARFGERGSTIRRINSLIGHFNYNFGSKYFVSVLANMDQLKEDHGLEANDIFPSLAFTWDIAKEPILRQLKNLDYIKVYYNWGIAGNYPLNGLSNDLYNSASYRLNETTQDGSYLHNLANHHMRREKVEEDNVGIDISLVNTRIKLAANYYKKYNSQLIILRDIPYYYGGGSIFLNIGEMANEGYEFTLDLVPIHSGNLHWQTKVGLSTNNQVIKKLDSASLAFKNQDILIPDFTIAENEVIGSIYGYDYRGIDTGEADMTANMDGRLVSHYQALYHKVDTVGEQLTDNDKKIIGNAIPDWTMNWHNVIKYKNFQLDMLWYGVFGVDKYNSTRASTYMSGINKGAHELLLDSIRFLADPTIYESSYFVENASFLRLKNITVSYEAPKLLMNQIRMRYSVSAENLVTFTKYKGLDPEATIYTGNNFSDNALDRGAYPIPMGLFFTINMTLL